MNPNPKQKLQPSSNQQHQPQKLHHNAKTIYNTRLFIIIVGVLVRVIVVVYISKWENITKQKLAGTDIDYKVYTDAAFYESPYDRHTYRYSPILAYLMIFNNHIQYAGKLIFILFDIIAMLGLSNITKQINKIPILKLYSYNPLFIYLTARGSCQSISLALMFWCCYFIFGSYGNTVFNDLYYSKYWKDGNRQWVRLGYVIYGLWVHFRVYPIILLPIILVHEYKISKKSKTNFVKKFIQMSIYSGGIFIGLLIIFYIIYGDQFVHQTYLYHISRLDNRHSFSPFFYDIYLGINTQSIIRSLPQCFVIVVVIKRVHKSLSPYYAVFIITYAFVSFNKVITMQYYMWIFGALLLLLPESTLLSNPHRRFQKSLGYLIQWVLGITLWVWLSIRLQKNGENVYNLMWFICIMKLYTDLWGILGFLSTIENKQINEKINKQVDKKR